MPSLKQYYGNTADVVFDKKLGSYTTLAAQKKAKKDAQELSAYKANLSKGSSSNAQGKKTVKIPMPTAKKDASTPKTGITIPNDTAGQATANAPTWWIPTAYSTPNAQQSFANAANAILPTLSPEDQRSVASYLATNFKDVYGKYSKANFDEIPTQLTNERQEFINPARARSALQMLNTVNKAAGGGPVGKGYTFLRNALGMVSQYTNSGSPMTREQYTQFANAIKEMGAQSGNDLSAYNNLAQMFNMPNFTAGDLVSNAGNSRLNL